MLTLVKHNLYMTLAFQTLDPFGLFSVQFLQTPILHESHLKNRKWNEMELRVHYDGKINE